MYSSAPKRENKQITAKNTGRDESNADFYNYSNLKINYRYLKKKKIGRLIVTMIKIWDSL